jgi:hypothetical protein
MIITDGQIPLKDTSLNVGTHYTDLEKCISCGIKLFSDKYSGTNINTDDVFDRNNNKIGISFDDNSATRLQYRSSQYNLTEARIIRQGHQFESNTYDGEIQFYFGTGGKFRLCIPIRKDITPVPDFFSYIGKSENRPAISTVIPAFPNFLVYSGGSDKSTYIVSTTPIGILTADYDRLKIGGLYSDRTITPTSIQSSPSNFRRIDSIVLKPTSDQTAGVALSAVKCRPIVPERDIQNNRLYVGGDTPGDTTLDDELGRSVSEYGNPTPDGQQGITVSSIETTIGIVIGVLVAVVGIGIPVWLYFRKKMNDRAPKAVIAHTGGKLLRKIAAHIK